MATYYVDKTGVDDAGRDGLSLGAAWLTISYACGRVTSSGNTIHVNDGTFNETTCTLAVGVTLEGNGDTTIVTASTLTTEWSPIIVAESVTQLDGAQEIRSLYFDGNDVSAQAISCIGRNNVKIHDCKFYDFVYTGIAIRSIDGAGEAEEDEPSDYSTGIEFYNNTVINCAGSGGGWLRGALFIGSTDGMLIHDCTITCVARPSTAGVPLKFWYWGGWHKGTKIYNCTIEKDATREGGDYGFAIESLWSTGFEIYDNTIIGSIDPNDGIIRSPYTYSLWVHDNDLGPETRTGDFVGIQLEFRQTNVTIERNHFRNNSAGICCTIRTETFTNIVIRYNVFENLTDNGVTSGGFVMLGDNGYHIDSLYVYNNVFHANPTYPSQYGIIFDWNATTYTADLIDITNNIFVNFLYYWLQVNHADGFTVLNTRNNDRYNNGNSNNYDLTGTPGTHNNTNNITNDPLFVSSTDFRLQNGSPCKDTGLDVGLTSDYLEYVVPFNSIPDMGAYEYGSGPASSYVVIAKPSIHKFH